MLYSQKAARENVRNRDGKRVFYLGKGDLLTSDARDYLNRERIEILPADQAKPERWKLLGGGFSEEKPEDMTHLNGTTLVKKTHPRIGFRGAVDTLQAQILLCGLHAPHFAGELEELLELARNLLRWDVLEEEATLGKLCGLTEEELRQHSHRPQEFYGVPHFMPSLSDGPEVLHLNRLRCSVRSTELAAARAFCDRDGNCTRPDLLQILNRMSSMVYLLMIRQVKRNNEKSGGSPV